MLPVWGIGLYIVLYVVAALLYPGGSDIDKTATGYSWQHNYWCELMARTAQNGQPNTARPVAVTAMIILAISLIAFWYHIARLFSITKNSRNVIRYCGITSVVIMPLLLTGAHDPVINISGLFGIIAITGILVNLFRDKLFLFFFAGIICLLLCIANNYIYHTNHFIYYLPVIQKVTFLAFLGWFAGLTIKLYDKERMLEDHP